ncbi:hypothetical protein FVE85_2074 [Porphyridium purpureum]|uniref:RNA-dependent RNA polymerase n=1 Tax=Porphyridium purpureum TaxID=35688 RepID=A0A5J4YWG6_PORPP|nr:hypothetical protein FVE85_2074 [Porphyridium purpureum]|eukprot:POR2629..scf209_3
MLWVQNTHAHCPAAVRGARQRNRLEPPEQEEHDMDLELATLERMPLRDLVSMIDAHGLDVKKNTGGSARRTKKDIAREILVGMKTTSSSVSEEGALQATSARVPVPTSSVTRRNDADEIKGLLRLKVSELRELIVAENLPVSKATGGPSRRTKDHIAHDIVEARRQLSRHDHDESCECLAHRPGAVPRKPAWQLQGQYPEQVKNLEEQYGGFQISCTHLQKSENGCFLTLFFGHRAIRIFETCSGTKEAPAVKIKENGMTYELVSSKQHQHMTGPFLDLLCDDFEVEEHPMTALDGVTLMEDGCGTISDAFLEERLGMSAHAAARLVCIQVRVVAPRLGVFKGVLMRRPGSGKILLSPSMRKVGPSVMKSNAADWAMLLVTSGGIAPSQTNVTIGRFLSPRSEHEEKHSPVPEIVRKPISDMIGDALRASGVHSNLVSDSSRRHDAYLMGAGQPVTGFPPGVVYVTGLNTTMYASDHVLVTRIPVTQLSDLRLLPCLTTRPCDMSVEDWDWLESLPFGALIFSSAVDGIEHTKPIPEMIGGGDLDGDLYFVCWDAMVVRAFQPNNEQPEYRAPTHFAGITNELRSPNEPTSQTTEGTWLTKVQAHLRSPEVLAESSDIGKVYAAWKRLRLQKIKELGDERAAWNHPDVTALAQAYVQTLERGKHGGIIKLPDHLKSITK